MALTGRFFLQPIKASLTTLTSSSSPLSLSRNSLYVKLEPIKTWVKSFEPAERNLLGSSHWKLCVQRCNWSNFDKSGIKFGMGSVFAVPVLFGSIFLRKRVAYAMDDFDILRGDHHFDLSDASAAEEDSHKFLAFARKLLLPVLLIVNVFILWDHPFILASRIILILVVTKPSPFSVYLFIEQLRHQFIHRHPILYKFKSLYAKKVEVEDYTFLCLARVEIKDQKLTLIGILGSWWVWPWSSREGAFLVFRKKVLQIGNRGTS